MLKKYLCFLKTLSAMEESKLYMLVLAHNVSHKVKTWAFHGRSANVKAPAIECIWAVK